jgi:hypothetical protein
MFWHGEGNGITLAMEQYFNGLWRLNSYKTKPKTTEKKRSRQPRLLLHILLVLTVKPSFPHPDLLVGM